jgi:hypothetical protein
MDTGLHFRVLWRFRALVGAGAVLALLLAFVSYVRVNPLGSPVFKYRKAQQYVSYSTLFVTQPGFPWGQLNAPSSADPGRFTSLAIVYSQLATTDPVRRLLLASGPVNGTVQVAPVLDQTNQQPLPLISIAAFGNSPSAAISLAKRQTSALLTYIRRQQEQSATASDNRVDVSVVRTAQYAALFKGRSMKLPFVVFLAVMVAVCALAFVLENMRPRIRSVDMPVAQRTSASDAA